MEKIKYDNCVTLSKEDVEKKEMIECLGLYFVIIICY